MTGLFFFFRFGDSEINALSETGLNRASARRLSYTRFAIREFRFRRRARDRGVRRGCPSRRSAGKPTAAAAAMFVPTSAFRRFSESPKHPIDCPTSFAGTRELVHRSPPVPPRSLYPAPLLLSFLPPSTISLAALGMANTPPCRGYVSRMRPPLPPAAIHPSPFPRLCHARRRASQYGRQLVQPSPLFLPWPLLLILLYNAINFSSSSSSFSFATSATIATTTTSITTTTSTFQPPSLPSTFSLSPSIYLYTFLLSLAFRLMVHVAFVHAGVCSLFAFAFSLSLSLFSRVPLTHASARLTPIRLHRYLATTSHAYLWEAKIYRNGLGYVQESAISRDSHREAVQGLATENMRHLRNSRSNIPGYEDVFSNVYIVYIIYRMSIILRFRITFCICLIYMLQIYIYLNSCPIKFIYNNYD